jgi:peptidoglycan/xylan/chitin deacetylase (PgdA/CDA1 family)
VAIHFDDCYRDVRTQAAVLLEAAGIPATAFVSSGFVDTGRVFLHDQAKSPHRFENFHTQDLRELGGLGVGVAAHTVNHVDLGTISLEQAQIEVEASRRELEQLLSHPVLLFSFPFGGIRNIREEVREMAKSAGYRALFSAHGGFVDGATKIFDIPRLGVSSDHSPLALMMELEGISLAHLRHWLRTRSGSPSLTE